MSVQDSWHAAQEMRAAFKLFDLDDSGTISPEELLAILTRPETGRSLALEDAKEIIASFDTDGCVLGRERCLHRTCIIPAWPFSQGLCEVPMALASVPAPCKLTRACLLPETATLASTNSYRRGRR